MKASTQFHTTHLFLVRVPVSATASVNTPQRLECLCSNTTVHIYSIASSIKQIEKNEDGKATLPQIMYLFVLVFQLAEEKFGQFCGID